MDNKSYSSSNIDTPPSLNSSHTPDHTPSTYSTLHNVALVPNVSNSVHSSQLHDSSHEPCTHLGSFPWLPLSTVDHKVLTVTVSRLRSHDVECVRTTCLFFDEILLSDFPPEVFLQRPTIVECLLHQLTQENNGVVPVTAAAALKCLHHLSERLRDKLDNQTNLFDSRDHKINTSTLSEDIEHESPETLHRLQTKQMAIVTYCSSVLSAVINLTFVSFDRHLPWLDNGCRGDSTSLTSLFEICLQCVTYLSQILLGVVRGRGQTDIEEVSQFLDVIGAAVSQSLSKLRRARESGLIPHELLKLLCPLVTVLANWFVQLVCSASSTSESPLEVLSSKVRLLMKELLNDAVVRNVINQQMMDPLMSLIKTEDDGLFSLLVQENALGNSFQQLHHFLSSADKATPTELLETANGCLLGLNFSWGTREKVFVEQIVQKCCSLLGAAVTGSDEKEEKCRQLLLNLTSHNRTEVNIAVYEQLKVYAESSVGNSALIFTERPFLYRLCFDLLSPSLVSLTHSLLSFLVQNVDSNGASWKLQLEYLLESLPYIECCSSLNTDMITVVHKLLDRVPSHTKMISLLRMMYSKVKLVRERAFSELNSKYLTTGTRTDDSLCDLLIVTSPPPLKPLYIPLATGSSSFKSEDVKNLLSVAGSRTMDCSLKASAFEQLGIVLKDHSLHEAAIKEGLLSLLQNALKSLFTERGKTDKNSSLLTSCLVCLHLLVLGNETVRLTLQTNEQFMITLIQGALQDTSIRPVASQIIASITFSTVSQFLSATAEVKLHEKLLKCLQLPFPVKSLSHTSIKTPPTQFNTSPPTQINASLIMSPPTRHRLWVQYALSLAGGVNRLPYRSTDGRSLVLNREDVYFGANIAREEMIAASFDLQCLLYSCPSALLNHCLELMAKSNDETICSAVNISLLLFSLDSSSCDEELSVDIKLAFERYLARSADGFTEKDEAVLTAVMNCLKFLMSCDWCNLIGQEQLDWVVNAALEKDGICLSLLRRSDTNKDLTKSVLHFITSLPSVNTLSLSFLQVLHQLISLSADSTNNHLLYLTLQCLYSTLKNDRSLTSKVKWIDISMELITSLRKVIWSFVSERGTMFGSFISKGVVRYAVQGLTYLLYSVSKHRLTDKEWLGSWFNSGPSLVWIHSLLHDRDPLVSSATYSLLAILTSSPDSSEILLVSWKDLHTHGLLGAMVDTGLDCNETDLIRHQALAVAVNLLLTCDKYSLPILQSNNNEEEEEKDWRSVLTAFLSENGLVKTFRKHFNHLIVCCDELLDMKPVKCVLELSDKLPDREQVNPVTETSLMRSDEWKSVYGVLVRSQPLLVNGLCQFVCCGCSLSLISIEMLREDIVQSIERLLHSNILLFLFNTSLSLPKWLNTIMVWIELYTRTISLLHVIVVARSCDFIRKSCDHNDESRDQLSDIVSSCLKLLQCRPILLKGCLTKFDALCLEIVSFLKAIAEDEKANGDEIVWLCLVKNWSSFTELLIYSLRNQRNALSIVCLTLFCSLLSSARVTTPLNSSSSLSLSLQSALDEAQDREERGEGGRICQVFLEAIESRGGVADGKLGELVWNGLCLLLASSQLAKDTAVKAGLLETLNNKLLTSHSKLTIDLVGRGASVKKKIFVELNEIVKCFRLFQNIFHKSNSLKCAAVKDSIVNTLNVLWPLSAVNAILLKPFLQLLIVLTANCTEVHAALVFENRPAASLFQQLLKVTSLSLMSTTRRSLSSSDTPAYAVVLKELFAILCNCVLSQECRTVLKKTNFISSFLLVNPKVNSSNRHLVISEWLKLLVNLTFTTDGQSILAKLTGSIDLLYDIWCHSNKRRDDQTHCAMILRNMCFYGPIKSMLAAHEGVLNIFTHCIAADEISITSTGIWSLVYNCSKLRGILRNSSIHQLLSKSATQLRLQKEEVPEELVNVMALLGDTL